MNSFFSSQLFGIILGAFLTGGFTWLIDCCRGKREERLYLKRKRELLYQKMYDFSMRLEKDIRDNNSVKMSKKTKDLWNEIQIESIFGKQSTMELFYDLYEDLLESAEEYRKDAINILTDNNKKILNFYAHIKNELGIKD